MIKAEHRQLLAAAWAHTRGLLLERFLHSLFTFEGLVNAGGRSD